MLFYEDVERLFEGVVTLYRRPGKRPGDGVWQVRIKVEGELGYVIQSCRTRDFADAKAYAKRLYIELQHKVLNGVPLKDWTFRDHWQDWIKRKVDKQALSTTREKWHRQYFCRYFERYFGSRRLTDISPEFAEGYWAWRLNFWRSAEGQGIVASNPLRKRAKTRTTRNIAETPSDKTLAMEQSALNEIFKDAWSRQRTQRLIEFKAPKPGGRHVRRPGFDDNELALLREQIAAWAACRGVFAPDRPNKHNRYRRLQLACYVIFLVNSGLRPGEADELRWADIGETIRDGQPVSTIQVARETKTGDRLTVPMPEAIEALGLWKQVTKSGGLQDKVWQGDDPNKTFRALLQRIPYLGREGGLWKDANGEPRTLYSLRHTYATQRLLDGVSIFALAKNMGTSVHYIETHYGHVSNLQMAEELTGNRRSKGAEQTHDDPTWAFREAYRSGQEHGHRNGSQTRPTSAKAPQASSDDASPDTWIDNLRFGFETGASNKVRLLK
jgi:integrase